LSDARGSASPRSFERAKRCAKTAVMPLRPRRHFVQDGTEAGPERRQAAIYVEDKIVFVLRDKPHDTVDNGVWLATTHEHHESLRRQFPNMRSIQVFGKKATGWQVLPADARDFEEAALRACELVLAKDPRIGKVPPAPRRSRARIR
jgi:hypothetical protein